MVQTDARCASGDANECPLCYTLVMEKTLLIAGKEIPDGSDFASGAQLKSRNVVITAVPSGKDSAAPVSDDGSTAAVWNRSSPLSARSVVLACENTYNQLDEAVLYFDETAYASEYNRMGAEECAFDLDMMTAGYQYMALEILSRFEQKKSAAGSLPGKLVFLHKTNPSLCDAVKSPSVRTQTNALSSPLVASASAAFASFAENIAASYDDRDNIEIVLVTCDSSNETAQKDSALASWLCGYLDMVDAQKNKPSPKQMVSWIKAGAKSPGGFSLFK